MTIATPGQTIDVRLLTDYNGETDYDDLSDAVHGDHPELSPEQVDAVVDAHLRQRAVDYLVGRRALAVLVEAADGDHERVISELTGLTP